jgi:hypothetical protein
MIPELRLRIDTTIRGLLESVIPAIRPDAKQALEQAHLAVSHLRLLAEQCDRAYDFQVAELREFSALVRDLLETDGAPPASIAREHAAPLLAKAEAMAAAVIPAQKELAQLVFSLKAVADEILKEALASDGAAIRQRAFERVIERAGRQIERERVWASKAGFDMGADKLPPLDVVLSGAAS